jgi:Flp pilus assembly protein TadG
MRNVLSSASNPPSLAAPMTRHPRPSAVDLREDESGAVVVIFALLLTVLLGMAAFAIDFGWIYLSGARIQHGADAAALSGVIYEPGDKSTAYAQALEAASENGYVYTDPGTTVTPQDFSEVGTPVHNKNQLAVTVTDTVPTFFMTVFGIDSVSITKTGIAEYVLPLAMGSDEPYFGTDPTISGRDPNFWANIHGYYTGRRMGDRYSSQCNHGGRKSGCEPNPDRRPTEGSGTDRRGGYLYGIEVPTGATALKVDIFDGAFYRNGSDYFLVGDNPQGGSQGPTTTFMLYSPDPTPLDTTDGNELLCTVTYAPQDTYADFDGDGDVGSWDNDEEKWKADPDDDQNNDGWFDWTDVEAKLGTTGFQQLWDRMCPSESYADAGIYPLRVVIEDPGGSDDRGLNRYSLRASATGGEPRIFGLGDMAVYVNFASNSAVFDLADVPDVHAGKDLVIDLWDSDSGIGNVSVRPPGGSTACTWTASSGEGGSSSNCSIPTGSYDFNDEQMQIRIAIDNEYTCGTECWWTIELAYPGGANDTTTWSAHIEGNPVRLVE